MIRPVMALVSIQLMASLAQVGAAQSIDQAKVREAIKLPTLSFSFNFQFFGPPKKEDPKAEIAALKKTLRGVPSDAEIYNKIGDLYGHATPNEVKQANAAYRQAISLFRRQLAQQPQNGWVMAQLGTCLSAVEQNAEAEKMLREAVRVSPKDWRAWTDLGDFLPKHALLQIGITNLSDVTLNGPEAAVDQLEPLLKKTGPAHAIAVLQKASAEAHSDFDRAVSLSPNSPRSYMERGNFVYSDAVLTQNIIKLLKEETPNTTNIFPSEMVKDMSRAADLAPDDPERQAAAAISEIALVATTAGDTLKTGEPGAIDRMPAQSRDRIKREIQRLHKIVGEKDRRNAQIAVFSLINIDLMGGETAQAEQMAKLALTREPASLRAWDALCAVYTSAEKYQDLAKAQEDRFKHEDTPHNCLALAETYDYLSDATRASKLVLDGVQRFPNDLLLNLAAVDVLLKQTEASALQLAEKHMTHAQALFAKLSEEDQKSALSNLYVTQGAYLALTGKATDAREALQKVLAEDEDDKEAKKLVAILEASPK